jgi:hypothetical protein
VFNIKYKNRNVRWMGTIYSINEKPIGTGYVLHVRMNPTESAMGTYDLSVSAPEEIKNEILPLNKGNRVVFEGKIASQGGAILGHEIRITHIEAASVTASKSKSEKAQLNPKAKRVRRLR